MIGTQIFHRLNTDIAAFRQGQEHEIPVFSKAMQMANDQQISLDIHWVQGDGLRDSACALINRRYDWRGYGNDHRLKASAYHATFSAVVGDVVVGTVTLAVDSQAGLAADSTFKEEVDGYRAAQNAYVCELTKLAADSDLQSPAILAALFHVVLLYGQLKYSCTDLFIEVNPRHRRFYEAMLGFKRVGELKTNASVAAPSQLMHLAVGEIRPQIEAHRGADPAAASRSLYPHFLSKRDEEMVLMRLFSLMSQPETTTAREAFVRAA